MILFRGPSAFGIVDRLVLYFLSMVHRWSGRVLHGTGESQPLLNIRKLRLRLRLNISTSKAPLLIITKIHPCTSGQELGDLANAPLVKTNCEWVLVQQGREAQGVGKVCCANPQDLLWVPTETSRYFENLL